MLWLKQIIFIWHLFKTVIVIHVLEVIFIEGFAISINDEVMQDTDRDLNMSGFKFLINMIL